MVVIAKIRYMSELLAEYTVDRFPYFDILDNLTEEVKADELEPVDAYIRFLDARDEHGLRPYFDYGSTSITTGGHALVPDKPMSEIIAANTNTAREMVALMTKQGGLIGKEVLLPVDLGYTGWTQSDFMTFWSLVISGPELRSLNADIQGVAGFERQLRSNLYEAGVDRGRMDDSRLSREERRPEYARFVNGYAAALMDSRVDCLPAHSLISLVDPDISLGCWAEKRLAEQLDIPTQRVAPVKVASIDEAVTVPTLREDMKIITALGGTVCVAPRGSMLVLVGDHGGPEA
jgi:hypothetical protein